MSYKHIGDALKSSEFLHRVQGCVIDLAAAIIAATQDSGAIQDDAAHDLTTAAVKNWNLNYIKGSTVCTDLIIAKYLLLNTTIADAPLDCADSAMNWQLKHVMLQLVAIG